MKIIRTLFLLITVVFFYRCERTEFENSSTPENPAFSVTKAKSWFDENFPKEIEMKSGNADNKKVTLRKNWKKSVLQQNEKYEIVETELLAEGKFNLINSDVYQKWIETNDEKWLTSVSRLIIMKSKTDGSITAFIMCIAGNADYLKNKNWATSNYHYLNYLKKETDFTGFVMYYNLTGTFNNGWQFEDGKVTGKIIPDLNNQIDINLKSAYVCYVTTFYTEYQECKYYPNYENATDVYCDPPVWEITDVSIECVYLQPDGSGGYLPPVESPCLCDICLVCGGCLAMELKSATIPGGSGTPTVNCPVCSCPKSLSAENALGVDMTGPAEAPDDAQKIAAIRDYLAGTEKTITDNDGKLYFWYNGYLCCYYNGQWYGEYEDNKWESFVPLGYVFSVRDKIESLFGKPIADIAVFASRYVLPFEDAYIVWSGVDFDGIQSNTQVAAAFLLLEFVPGNDILKGYKPVARIVAGTEMIIKYEGNTWKAVFKEFTESNYRYNLGQFTGIVPDVTIHAHHVFPQATEFLPQWERVGLNIHEPWYMQWWTTPFHQQNSYAYNQEWRDFFTKFPNADYNQILEKGRELMEKYGFEVFY